MAPGGSDRAEVGFCRELGEIVQQPIDRSRHFGDRAMRPNQAIAWPIVDNAHGDAAPPSSDHIFFPAHYGAVRRSFLEATRAFFDREMENVFKLLDSGRRGAGLG